MAKKWLLFPSPIQGRNLMKLNHHLQKKVQRILQCLKKEHQIKKWIILGLEIFLQINKWKLLKFKLVRKDKLI